MEGGRFNIHNKIIHYAVCWIIYEYYKGCFTYILLPVLLCRFRFKKVSSFVENVFSRARAHPFRRMSRGSNSWSGLKATAMPCCRAVPDLLRHIIVFHLLSSKTGLILYLLSYMFRILHIQQLLVRQKTNLFTIMFLLTI